MKSLCDQADLRIQDDVDQVVATENPARKIKTVAEYADSLNGYNWTEAIVDEISKHCAAQCDVGQSKPR